VIAPLPGGEDDAATSTHVSAPEAAGTREDLIAAFLGSRGTGLSPSETQSIARAVVAESARQGVDPRLVLAVMHVESRFDPFAVSPVGAMGIMQIMPNTGRDLARRLGVPWQGARTLFDPVVNVRMGVAYLRWLQRRYDDLPTALAAYNWGPGEIDGRLRAGDPVPRGYAQLVLNAHSRRMRSL